MDNESQNNYRRNWRWFYLKWQFFLLLAIGGAVIWWLNYGNICRLPINYRLGQVDARFGLTRAEIMPALEQAEQWWESSLGADLFEYDTGVEYALTINFVFDERQRATQELRLIQSQKLALEDEIENIVGEYRDLRALYDQREVAVLELQTIYNDQLEQFKQLVQVWNKRGGAPHVVYDELQKEQAELDEFVIQINSFIAQQNELATRINQLADTESETVQIFNEGVREFNENYVVRENYEEEQGIYGLDTINVYQFDDQSDLISLLAHELGHALGLDHSDDPQSVMYPKKNERQVIGETRISSQSMQVLKKRCNLK
ncbi:matrixin family metalloprotease [Patescibacteria group bacterium]|nr:matrixin family metalloprotease [Patescibacteria group bacterium]MBU1028653.1 matrixin family metalloprotease [Patescibacteria group bacterium]MBU1916368.1 matrixin family metalloprotease [Patescibacteria group bacterium]